VTFGARLSDIAALKDMAGRPGWKTNFGRRPEMTRNSPRSSTPQMMFIKYNGLAAAKGIPGWPPVNQYRALTYLKQDVAGLWEVPRKDRDRRGRRRIRPHRQRAQCRHLDPQQPFDLPAARVRGRFLEQHFNIGRQADFYATAALPVYDLTVIRPRAFGNFHDLLSAVATSASMPALPR